MQSQISLKLVLEGKTGKEIPRSSRLEFLENVFSKQFALLNVENNTSWPWNRRGMADFVLLRILFAIRQKSREPSSWEMMDSFALLAYTSLTSLRTLLQQLLPSLNFRFCRFILLVQTKNVISINYDSNTSS